MIAGLSLDVEVRVLEQRREDVSGLRGGASVRRSFLEKVAEQRRSSAGPCRIEAADILRVRCGDEAFCCVVSHRIVGGGRGFL